MGARGPARMPTATLKARDSWRAKDRVDYDADHLLCERAPSPPKHLSADAKACWKDVIKPLMAMKVIGPGDLKTLERYCVHWSRWRRANDLIEENGMFEEDENGRMVESSYSTAAYRADTALLKIEQQFGLTPSSRSRVPLKPADKKPEQNAAAKYVASGKNLKLPGA
jgi:P27 family predicted phage terminase small subunit